MTADKTFSIIGLTGGIGCGKSVVSHILRALEIPVYDCDSQAKRLTLSNLSIREQLISLLGPETYQDEGRKLNKRLMADFLFRSPGNAQKLNAIIHPAVRLDFQQWANQKKAQWYPRIAIESAILYESGFHTLATEIWAITASENTRLRRIADRDGISTEEASRKIEFQRKNQKTPPIPSRKTIKNEPGNALFPQITKLLSSIPG